MAGELIRIAAERAAEGRAEAAAAAGGLYDEFCARFPYEETEDQLAAIEAVLDDLGRGRPMDRLVCGDVGFGKTEVALRAAFVTAHDRQAGRGRGADDAAGAPALRRPSPSAFAVCRSMSRRPRGLSAPKELKRDQEGPRPTARSISSSAPMRCSAKAIKFRDLGLLIVDEEQHFGVKHKERLKELRAEVHVLTLSATPIPRTLQLALTGVRELSIIATPPVDRLAVRTFVAPFDPLIDPRGAAARALSRRAGVLRRAAHRGSSPTSRNSSTSRCRR